MFNNEHCSTNVWYSTCSVFFCTYLRVRPGLEPDEPLSRVDALVEPALHLADGDAERRHQRRDGRVRDVVRDAGQAHHHLQGGREKCVN